MRTLGAAALLAATVMSYGCAGSGGTKPDQKKAEPVKEEKKAEKPKKKPKKAEKPSSLDELVLKLEKELSQAQDALFTCELKAKKKPDDYVDRIDAFKLKIASLQKKLKPLYQNQKKVKELTAALKVSEKQVKRFQERFKAKPDKYRKDLQDWQQDVRRIKIEIALLQRDKVSDPKMPKLSEEDHKLAEPAPTKRRPWMIKRDKRAAKKKKAERSGSKKTGGKKLKDDGAHGGGDKPADAEGDGEGDGDGDGDGGDGDDGEGDKPKDGEKKGK